MLLENNVQQTLERTETTQRAQTKPSGIKQEVTGQNRAAQEGSWNCSGESSDVQDVAINSVKPEGASAHSATGGGGVRTQSSDATNQSQSGELNMTPMNLHSAQDMMDHTHSGSSLDQSVRSPKGDRFSEDADRSEQRNRVHSEKNSGSGGSGRAHRSRSAAGSSQSAEGSGCEMQPGSTASGAGSDAGSPATTATGSDAGSPTPTATGSDPGSITTTTDDAGVPVYSAASDLAAADAVSSMPTSSSSMDVGATGDPTLPANTQNLGTLTINGDGDLSQLSNYGTLADEGNGTYVFDGDGNQVPQLVLNGVTGLTVQDSVFANVTGSGAVTIEGDSYNDTVQNSTFNNIDAGVDIYQQNNLMPSGIDVLNNTFSSVTGTFPTASVVQFAGAGSSEVAAEPGAVNDVSHNTITDGPSLSDPSEVNAAVGSGGSGQDIISSYNAGDGANENVETIVSSNLIDGGFISPDGTPEPNTAINFEISSDGVVANNLVENQPYAGIANDGSTNVNYAGNYVDAGSGMAGAVYANASENGINPTGEWTYNNSTVNPQVSINSGDSSDGWPEVYSPGGAPDDPGATNNWDSTGSGSDSGSPAVSGSDIGSTATGSATGLTATGSDTGSPANTATGSDAGSTTTTATGSDTGSPTTTATGTDTGSSDSGSSTASPTPAVAGDTSSYSAASDMAAANSIDAMPTDPGSMAVGSSGDPSASSDTQSLGTVTINGDSDLSQLSAYGTLTNDDGNYVFDGNGDQVPALDLNDVSNLTINDAVFANVSGSGAVTISGDSANDTVENSTFNNISSGVDLYQSNNVAPSGIDVVNNTFSDLTGPWPSTSAIQFGGAGSSETAADPGATNDVSHNTIIDGASASDPYSSNSSISGQDIISVYNYGNGSGENVNTLVSSNLIDGSYDPGDGSEPPDTAINAEISSNVTIANNLAENSKGVGIGEDGSVNVTVTGNYVDNAASSYNYGPENGINPTGNYTYNNASASPQNSAGWPELYAPDGLPPSSNDSNNWNSDLG